MLSLFDAPVVEVQSQARHDDPETSKIVAKQSPLRRGSERYHLLGAYEVYGALTDDEAAARAQCCSEYEARRRCSDLRRFGLIERTGETRESSLGNQSMVCRITVEGKISLSSARADL
jgi:hypothetical protein